MKNLIVFGFIFIPCNASNLCIQVFKNFVIYELMQMVKLDGFKIIYIWVGVLLYVIVPLYISYRFFGKEALIKADAHYWLTAYTCVKFSKSTPKTSSKRTARRRVCSSNEERRCSSFNKNTHIIYVVRTPVLMAGNKS